MSVCRLGYALGLIVFLLAPLVMPFRETLAPEAWQWSADDAARLAQLAGNTLGLTAGTVACATPIGLALAVLLFRTSFFGRRFFLYLLTLLLFVPLPVLVSSWQGFFGSDGFLPSQFWHNAEGRPWVSGLGAAIWIHTMAAVPWVSFIVGIGLTWVEPELEEEAAQSVGPWRVLLRVTLPRVRASIVAAMVFVALQTAGEVSVTEMMQVGTLAEEARAQFERADRSGLARTLLLALPALMLTWTALGMLAMRLERSLSPLVPSARAHRTLEPGPAWLRFLIGWALLIALMAPLASLVWKVGLDSAPPHWDADTARHFLYAEALVNGPTMLQSVGTALVAGIAIGFLALVGCWLAREARWLRALLFGVSIGAWVMPASVVGIGLKEWIQILVEVWPAGPHADALYFAPSPLPVIWAHVLRILPIAIVFLWPVVRLVPNELFEEARLSGAGTWTEFRHVVWPMTRYATAVTALAASALCVGEIAVSGRVETAGWRMFMGVLFNRMHTGADNTVAALSLLLIATITTVIAVTVALSATYRRLARRIVLFP
jgi:iron(III) transport system permease protein